MTHPLPSAQPSPSSFLGLCDGVLAPPPGGCGQAWRAPGRRPVPRPREWVQAPCPAARLPPPLPLPCLSWMCPICCLWPQSGGEGSQRREGSGEGGKDSPREAKSGWWLRLSRGQTWERREGRVRGAGTRAGGMRTPRLREAPLEVSRVPPGWVWGLCPSCASAPFVPGLMLSCCAPLTSILAHLGQMLGGGAGSPFGRGCCARNAPGGPGCKGPRGCMGRSARASTSTSTSILPEPWSPCTGAGGRVLGMGVA